MGNITLYWLTQIVFILFSVYHLFVGIPSFLSISVLRRIGKYFYSLQLPEKLDPRYEYVLKPLGFYAITLGLICFGELFTAEPLHRAYLLLCLAILLIARALGRYFYKDLVETAFSISWKRSKTNVVFNFLAAIFLLYLAFANYNI